MTLTAPRYWLMPSKRAMNNGNYIENYLAEVKEIAGKMSVEDINSTVELLYDAWKNGSQVVSFTPRTVGEKQKVEFLLYKAGEVEPYIDPLHLWLDVID